MTHKIKVNNVEIELTEEMIKEIKALPDEPEFEYPLFMKSDVTGRIVRFDGLQERTTVWDWICSEGVGKQVHTSIPHTNTTTWEPVPYDKERGLWHGQPVMAWNYDDTHERRVRFYDAINKRTFRFDGNMKGYTYSNIEAIPSEEYKPWMFEAYKTLEGI
jgi:hypothetical protein